MATELVKPTSTATKPAVKADRLKSLKNCMWGILAPHPARPVCLTRPLREPIYYNFNSLRRLIHKG